MRLSRTCAMLLLPLLASCGSREEDDENNEAAQRIAQLEGGGVGALSAGQWESRLTVAEIDLPSVASSQKPKIISMLEEEAAGRNCLEKAAVKNPPADFFSGNADDCMYRDFAIDKGIAKISLTCETATIGGVDIKLAGPLTSGQYAFDADIVMRLPMVGRVRLRGKLDGARSGECAA